MSKRLATTAVFAAALLLGGAPALGHGSDDHGYGMGPGMMGQGQVMLHCYAMTPGMMQPGQGQSYGMGPGMMGPDYGMGQGQGYGMSPGMMSPGMMGPGMMSPGQGYGMGSGMMQGRPAMPDRDLSADDVRQTLEQQLAWRGNPRLKLGAINEVDEDTVTAEIVTLDGSVVDKLAVDRHTGMMRRVPE